MIQMINVSTLQTFLYRLRAIQPRVKAWMVMEARRTNWKICLMR